MRHPKHSRGGFSMTELVIVIAIIAVLISILIPVVSKVRRSAQTANTKNFISQLDGATNRYYGDFHGYPGPLRYDEICGTGPRTTAMNPAGNFGSFGINPATPATSGYDISAFTPAEVGSITMSENLVVGLMGGLQVGGTAAAPTLLYDPTAVGRGPNSLNVLNPKHYDPYIDDTANLSWRTGPNGKTGQFADNAGSAADSRIPEFVDTFPSPMPILYLRSKTGVAKVDPTTAGYGPGYNGIITNNTTDPAGGYRYGSYDISQYMAYTVGKASPTASIGEEKTVRPDAYVGLVFPQHGLDLQNVTRTMDKGTPNYQYPYSAFNYFTNPSIQNTARQKDQYVLISAGPDRVYGTDDDICSFGSVKP
jgi:prepilin-type N-terminal cleavage/methylation domain-containing protein